MTIIMLHRRLKANGLHFYGVEQRYLLKWICLILVVSVLMFGPICGVIAGATLCAMPGMLD